MAVGIPNFPTSLDAASDLVEATNNASTTINMVGGLSNSATTITVVSTAAFPSTGIIRIDDELISYSAKTNTTFTVQTRGFESSTAASHIDGATVSLDITAASNNAKNTAIIALETKIGTGSSTPTANTVLRGTGTGTSAFGQVGLTTDVTGTLPAANGGTGITSLGSGVATFLGTPSSANLASAVTDETGSGALVFGTSPTISRPTIDNPSLGYTTTVMTGGTTTLTNTSNFRQFFTGDANFQDVVLPVASTMVLGQGFEIHVNSIYYVTVRSSGNNIIANVQGGQSARLTCILTSGTGTSSWDFEIIGGNSATGTGSLVFGTQPGLTLPSIGSTGFTIAGSSGGSTTIVTSATGSGTVTIPAGTATLATTANARAFKNLIINGDMAVSQQNGTTNTSTADDVYALDRWYALTQSAAIQVQQQSDQESGTPFNSRLTQNQATAQRMGYAQIIEGKNCKYLRGQTVTLSFRLRCSASQAIRYAILEWTGTEDSVTSDVVNSWTNTTYTTGNFFISTTTTIPTNGVTSITPSANTWTDATALTVTLGTSFNNLTVFVWTEGTAAQNVTLDVSRVQLEPGSTATAFEYLPIDVQLARCQRYYWRQTGPLAFSYMSAFAPASSTTAGTALVTFPVQMRRDPTVVETSNLHLTDLFGANFTFTATDINTTVPNNAGPRMLVLGLTGASGLTQGRMYALRCNNNAAGFLGVSAEL